eukprot:COSAG02_NODE_3015_length_7550_cov_5.305597_3_plen_73_part_00
MHAERCRERQRHTQYGWRQLALAPPSPCCERQHHTLAARGDRGQSAAAAQQSTDHEAGIEAAHLVAEIPGQQ